MVNSCIGKNKGHFLKAKPRDIVKYKIETFNLDLREQRKSKRLLDKKVPKLLEK